MKNLKWAGLGLAVVMTMPFASLAKAGKEVGPHGGRLLKGKQFKVEFHLDKDRKAQVYFYGQDMKQTGMGGAKVSLKAVKGGGHPIELVKVSAVQLASKSALPSPDGYLVLLTVKVSGKPLDSFRFNFVEEICGECNHPEYACTCDH